MKVPPKIVRCVLQNFGSRPWGSRQSSVSHTWYLARLCLLICLMSLFYSISPSPLFVLPLQFPFCPVGCFVVWDCVWVILELGVWECQLWFSLPCVCPLTFWFCCCRLWKEASFSKQRMMSNIRCYPMNRPKQLAWAVGCLLFTHTKADIRLLL